MRPPNKSRSRNKNNNRSRNVGNIVNRVFESAGPEGKVRGTPQQVIDKYQALARDAQVSGDRVAAENFLQHAEHYCRLLSEALREVAEARQGSNEQPGYSNGNGAGGHDGFSQDGNRGDDRSGRGDPRGEQHGEGEGRHQQRGGQGDGGGQGRDQAQDKRPEPGGLETVDIDSPAVADLEPVEMNSSGRGADEPAPEGARRPRAGTRPRRRAPRKADTEDGSDTAAAPAPTATTVED